MLSYHSMAKKEKIAELLSEQGCKVYFIGIGGVSMSALAELLYRRGIAVAGSDIRDAPCPTDRLNIKRYVGHFAENILSEAPTLAVYSLAVDAENPELSAAGQAGILSVSRAELMGAVMGWYKERVAVIGSHGKSTVTAMLSAIFERAGRCPTVLSGADLGVGSCLLYGGDELLIYEGCEYKESFLHFSPTVTVLLNVDFDHTDYYADKEAVTDAFLRAVNLSENFCVINADDEIIRKSKSRIRGKFLTVGENPGADFEYKKIAPHGGGISLAFGQAGLNIKLSVLGAHNAANAAIAAGTAIALGVPKENVREALEAFPGIPRRQQLLGKLKGADVYYDYAHHPKEIEAVISTLRGIGYKSIAVIFGPHTYSRTKSLWWDFAKSLSLANFLYLTPIYPAREEPIPGIISENLAAAVRELGGRCEYLDGSADPEAYLKDFADCIVLMGAADLGEIYKKILVSIDKNGGSVLK